jgi:hypothetical protein
MRFRFGLALNLVVDQVQVFSFPTLVSRGVERGGASDTASDSNLVENQGVVPRDVVDGLS